MKKNKSKTVVVKVTALDIKNGVPGNGESCPIANALKRYKNELRRCATPTTTSVDINGIELLFNEFRCIKIPATAREFITAFDEGEKVQPFSFRIQL